MNDQNAQKILTSLVNGADPFTGTELSSGTVLQNVEVVRALLLGAAALGDRVVRASRRAMLPKNIGVTWTPEEQDRLVAAFKKKEDLETIAQNHGRTVRGVEARLELIGLITKAERKTQDRFGADQNEGAQRTVGRKRKSKKAA